jgi:hypothetical protein
MGSEQRTVLVRELPHRKDHGSKGEASLRTEQAIDDLLCDRIEQAYAFAIAHRSNDDDAMFMLYAMHAALMTRDAMRNTIDLNQMRRGEVINSMAKLL